MSIQIDVTKKHIPKDALRLISDYLLFAKASTEQIKKLEEHFKQTARGEQYQPGNMLITYFMWERPNRFIEVLVPIMLSKSYESEGCDFPSAEIFADIAYVILNLPRPEKKLNQISLVKEIVDFIHSHPVEN